jgi:hypothetical protein
MIVIDEKLDLMKAFKNNKLCDQIYDIIALHFNLNKWVRCEGTFDKITFIVVGDGDYNYDAKTVIISNMGVITCNNIKFENTESINKLLKPYWYQIYYDPIDKLEDINNDLNLIINDKEMSPDLSLVGENIYSKFLMLKNHINQSKFIIEDIIKTIKKDDN